MLFIDRFDAALKLIPGLRNYRNENGIIYAIPGGGVPIGYYLAKDYNFPMQLLLSKKIKHHENGSSIGAVGVHDQMIDERLNIPPSYIKNEISKIRKSFKDRYGNMMDVHQKTNLKGKMVFIVDDGIETGNTMLTAIRMVRAQNPKKIIVVTPIAFSTSAAKIAKEADDFYCLHILKNPVALGANYLNFSTVTDKEIQQLLKAANRLENAA